MAHLAQVNVARFRAPLEDPLMADFARRLDEINALAEASPGFVWRYEGTPDLAGHPPYDDPLLFFNLSVWESIEALADYVFRSDHAQLLRRRKEWALPMDGPHLAMWWVEDGHLPSVAEAIARLEHLRRHGESPRAFTFRQPFLQPVV